MLQSALHPTDWGIIQSSVDNISGMLHPGQGEWLFQVASSLPDYATILEIGAWKGRSTAALAYGCVGTHRRVFTIDTFRGISTNTDVAGELFIEEFLQNMDERDLLRYITPLTGRSEDFYSMWRKWAKQIDFLWVDGCHLYEVVRADLDVFFDWLKVGGILAMHDVWGHTCGGDAGLAWAEYLPRLDADSLHHDHNLAWGRKK